MAIYRTRVHIGKDRRVVVELPPETPEGEAEVTVEACEPVGGTPASEMLAVIERLHSRPMTWKPRTKEEIDAEIDAMRNEWDAHLSALREPS